MRPVIRVLLAASAVLSGCGERAPAPDASPPPPAAAAAPAPGAPLTPCATCKVIEIAMVTDETGNYFRPKEVEAHEGDILRFKLVIGVHNVHFLADSNPGKSGLPPMSQMLQLPGQTHDVLLSFGTGKFYFQCDPHAALGMKGRVEVERREAGT